MGALPSRSPPAPSPACRELSRKRAAGAVPQGTGARVAETSYATLPTWLAANNCLAPALDEDEIAGVHRGAVGEPDDLVVAVDAGVDLPVVRIDLGEARAHRRDAEAGELQEVAGRRAVAVKVDDAVAVDLAGAEHEGVVA